MSLIQTEEASKPLTLAPLENIFVLYHLHGNNPRSQAIYFQHPGPFKVAIDRGRKFCEKMGWRFLKVESFLTNLDDREKRQAEQDNI